MYCPEHMVLKNKYFVLWMYGNSDIPRHNVPFMWWINPLRYEIVLQKTPFYNHMVINKNGKNRIILSNKIYTAKQFFKQLL